MKDQIWQRDEVQSPCVNICVVHPEAGICVGCYRTLDEIAGWSDMTAATRAGLTLELPARAGRLKKRRGGRATKVKRSG